MAFFVEGEVTKTGTTSLVWNWSLHHINNGVFYEIREEKGYSTYIRLTGGTVAGNGWADCDVQPVPGGMFTIKGENGSYLGWQNGSFVSTSDHPISIILAKAVDPPKQYTLTVTVNDPSWGTVSGTDDEGNPTGQTDQFEVHSENVDESTGKGIYNAGSRPIAATAESGYLFDHWEMNNAGLMVILPGSWMVLLVCMVM